MTVEVGKKITAARENLNISRPQLAKLLNVQTNTVWRWEIGERNPDYDTLERISKILKTTISYFFGENVVTDNEYYPQKTLTRNMFDDLMMKMAEQNPDLIIHFRDLQKNINNLTPGDIRALADAYAHITGETNERIEKRLSKTSQHGEL